MLKGKYYMNLKDTIQWFQIADADDEIRKGKNIAEQEQATEPIVESTERVCMKQNPKKPSGHEWGR
jgi:hypothetical protein